MIAGKYTMICQRGSTFDIQMTLQYTNPDYPANCADPNNCSEFLPWDLTGYRARMQIRKYIESAQPIATLTTENAATFRITLGDPTPTDGKISLFIRAEDTKNITTSGIYDIEIISPTNEVDRILEGEFVLSQEVTR